MARRSWEYGEKYLRKRMLEMEGIPQRVCQGVEGVFQEGLSGYRERSPRGCAPNIRMVASRRDWVRLEFRHLDRIQFLNPKLLVIALNSCRLHIVVFYRIALAFNESTSSGNLDMHLLADNYS